MRRLLVVAGAMVVAMAAAPAAVSAQAGTLVESFSLDATDRETSSYSVVAGGRYALLLKGTLTDSAGAQFDSLYCRNDACGGAGTYVDNVLGMGFTDLDRRAYPGTFGPIQMYVNPLPPYISNSTSYATTQFTAPRSGRLELITNHGNLLTRPVRSGTLMVDLYRYSEPASGGGTTPGSTSTADPCGALARALGLAPASITLHAPAGDGDACDPSDPRRGNVFNAPGPGRARTVYAKITTRTKKAIVTVANGASGHVILAVAGRRQRVRRMFEAYAGWCMLGLYLNPDNSANYNSKAFAAVFNFKTGRTDVTDRQALCQYAAIVATVRAIEAEDAARANPPSVPAAPPSPSACKVGRVVVTPRTSAVATNVSAREMPALRIKQNCKQDPDGVMTMTYSATSGRTLSKELGTTRLGVTIARGRDGAPGGTLAMRVRLFR